MNQPRPEDISDQIASVYDAISVAINEPLDAIYNAENAMTRHDEVDKGMSVAMLARRKKLEEFSLELDGYEEAGDLEALRFCRQHMSRDMTNLGDLMNVISAMHQTGQTELSALVTDEHFHAHNRIKMARVDIRRNVRPGWFDTQEFRQNTRRTLALAYRDLSQVPLILELITKRHLLEADQIETVFAAMKDLSTPLELGAL